MNCEYCTFDIPSAFDRCPHCARPGLYPNVRAVSTREELSALNHQYGIAHAAATAQGAVSVFDAFERAVGSSVAVIVRPLRTVEELAASDRQCLATYYQLVAGSKRLPDDDSWDRRFHIEEELFRGYKEHVHFAALSLDGLGLKNYGDCSVTLRTDMIAHRTTVLVENGVLFVLRHKIPHGEIAAQVRGFRARWVDRGCLAVIKHSSNLSPTSVPGDFPDILMHQGATSADDSFIEAHIYGPMTVRTFKRVILHIPKNRKDAPKSVRDALRQRLKKYDVAMEER